MHGSKKLFGSCSTIALLSLACAISLAAESPSNEHGRPEARYDGFTRESTFVPTRDGIRLVADIFRPTRGGKVTTEELPVVWALQRYHRATIRDGRVVTIIESRYPWLERVIEAGYVAAIVDARGTGASQGVRPVELGDLDARDAYDVTEWLARQPWSNGRIGMYGRSFRGMTQYLAAGTNPPHLRAIFPEMAMYDAFATAYRQGVPLRMFSSWGELVSRLDARAGLPPDDDPESRYLKGWIEKRAESNMDIAAFADRVDRPDEVDAETGIGWGDISPGRFVADIRTSGIAIHHLAGWWDPWVDDALTWYQGLEGIAQKLTIGPWSHTGRRGLDFAEIHLEWYDHWLRGIDDGLMGQPPIRYATTDLAGRVGWSSAYDWPPPNVRSATFYLAGDAAPNPGRLGPLRPEKRTTSAREADYSATTGSTSRWTNSIGRPFAYRDLSSHDAKGFVWDSPPLEARTVVTGQPVARLRVSSTSPDADLFVYLEEVDRDGISHYVTEGMARASFATPGTRLDQAPAEVSVRLIATSWAFTKGNRMRVAVTLADRDNARGLVFDPAPEVRVHSGPEAPSRVELPIER